MENRVQSTNPAAPAWIVKFVEILISIFKNQKTNGIGSYIRWRKIVSEACLLVICFLGTAWRPMMAILIAGLSVLRVRDIQVKDAKGQPPDAVTDGLVMGSAIILSQVILAGVHSDLATSKASELAHGAGLSVLLVSLWRLLIYLLSRTNDPANLPDFKLFATALRLNVLLMVAAFFIAISSGNAVPGGFWRNFFISALTMVSMGLSCKMQLKTGRLFFNEIDGTAKLLDQPQDDKSDCRGESLPQPIKLDSSDARWAAFFRAMFVACVMATAPIAIWRWRFGDPSNIRWGQLLANMIAFAVLIAIWHVVTYFNLAVVNAMRREKLKRENEDQK